jgi:hypothetical protein
MKLPGDWYADLLFATAQSLANIPLFPCTLLRQQVAFLKRDTLLAPLNPHPPTPAPFAQRQPAKRHPSSRIHDFTQ